MHVTVTRRHAEDINFDAPVFQGRDPANTPVLARIDLLELKPTPVLWVGND
jgi:hypothetical protein